jgi:hypothetical protein
MSTTTVPVTVTPEAAARVAELGMQCELERMLEHSRQGCPTCDPSKCDWPCPTIPATKPRLSSKPPWTIVTLEYDPTEDELGSWKVDTFPPDVCRYFVIMTAYWTPHER